VPTPTKAPSSVLLSIERSELLELERSLSREWLETDGLGGFASSTVLLCNQRRYHGLLVAPLRASAARYSFLSHLEETLRPIEPELARSAPHGTPVEFGLSMARYREQFAPLGHRHMETFALAPWPSFAYRIGGLTVRREIQLARGRHAVLVRWQFSGQGPELELRLRPLLTFREADSLTFENAALDPELSREGQALVARPYPALPPLYLTTQGAPREFEPAPIWVRGLEYPIDLARGYDGHEDNFSPGWIALRLRPGMEVALAASLDQPVEAPLDDFRAQAKARAAETLALLERHKDERKAKRVALLELGADQFLYRAPMLTDDSPSAAPVAQRLGVVAGFPWFGEWGRDTFLSLPGLTLSRGKRAECAQALLDATAYLRGGLMPNIFAPRPGDSAYNSADAALWFARACLLLDRSACTGAERLELDGPLAQALRQIAEAYRAGTELGLGCVEEAAGPQGGAGLLRAGGPRQNATWMDAVTDGRAVTPRHGCAVELNALWYSLLAHLEELHERAGQPSAEWQRRKTLVGASFLQCFWVEQGRYLADVWRPGEPPEQDASVRPNMVLAAALEFSPLDAAQRLDVVRRAEFELLTARGLRTLSPRHPSYCGTYAGSSVERDRAYHQGTAWPWLLGSFVEARLRASGGRSAGLRALARLLEGFDEQLVTQGLGHVSEVFDGDPPHKPGGSIAQAWNTAEMLRAWELIGKAERGLAP
jgi:predicted glycogen debranching enzyme